MRFDGTKLSITLNDDKGFYLSDEEIKGHVVLNLSNDTSVKRIRVRLLAVEFATIVRRKIGPLSLVRKRVLHRMIKYDTFNHILFPSNDVSHLDNKLFTLSSGEHKFPFSIKVPKHYPSALRGTFRNYLQWTVEASVDRHHNIDNRESIQRIIYPIRDELLQFPLPLSKSVSTKQLIKTSIQGAKMGVSSIFDKSHSQHIGVILQALYAPVLFQGVSNPGIGLRIKVDTPDLVRVVKIEVKILEKLFVSIQNYREIVNSHRMKFSESVSLDLTATAPIDLSKYLANIVLQGFNETQSLTHINVEHTLVFRVTLESFHKPGETSTIETSKPCVILSPGYTSETLRNPPTFEYPPDYDPDDLYLNDDADSKYFDAYDSTTIPTYDFKSIPTYDAKSIQTQ